MMTLDECVRQAALPIRVWVDAGNIRVRLSEEFLANSDYVGMIGAHNGTTAESKRAYLALVRQLLPDQSAEGVE